MLRTIAIGSSLQVQGIAIGSAPDGKLMVRVGNKVFVGKPVPRLFAAKPETH